jgi:hypothetical protein
MISVARRLRRSIPGNVWRNHLFRVDDAIEPRFIKGSATL